MKTFAVIFCLISAGLCDHQDNQIVDNDSTDYVGNPDDFEIIERPCQVYDIHCIRKFFASHAKCTIAEGPLPDTAVRSQATYYFSSNITVVDNTQMITGLRSTRIEEFYINKATNNVVFAINIQNLSETTEPIYFNFHRRAREPVVGVAPGSVTFTSITFTAIIPNIDDMQLDKAEITAFSDTAFPPFVIGPQALASGDPTVLAEFIQFNSLVPFNVQEYIFSTSQFYPPFYIQTNICDFGLKVPE